MKNQSGHFSHWLQTYFAALFMLVALLLSGPNLASDIFTRQTTGSLPLFLDALASGDISSWQTSDIGDVNIPGSVAQDAGVITITGSGNDIWDNRDDFYYLHIPIEGDVTVTVRVLSVEHSHDWAKGALMMRETLAPGAVNIALAYSAHEKVALQWRPVQDERSYYFSRNAGPGPVWLKLERKGDVFTGYYSLDGSNWTITTSQIVAMTQNIYLGLAVSPHDSSQNNTAVFDNLRVDSEIIANLCQAQGAQCGVIEDNQGGQLQCGFCPVDLSCSSNTCQPVDPIDIDALCATAGAQCGVVRDGLGSTLSCGACDTGELCSNNRCEASCSLEQIDKGPLTDLFAYAPLQFAFEDLSPNQHNVQTRLFSHADDGEFPFESSVDMTDKSVTLDFSDKTPATQMTLSFKMIPATSVQSGQVMAGGGLTIATVAGSLNTLFATNATAISLLNNTVLKHRSCNHVAIQVGNNSVKSIINGNMAEISVDTASLLGLSEYLNIGPYAGKVWDVRIFNKALSSEEVAVLAQDCDDAATKVVPDPQYPNYLCGVYQCMYWPNDVSDTTQENFEYQLHGHDMTWEHNVMTTGMYQHGQLCQEYAKPRDLLLSSGYRNAWVNKFTFEQPWNQYVLHENFHAYQSRTGGSEKFLAESSASWGAFSMKPTAQDSLLGMYTLQPHLALWTTQSSVFEPGIIDYAKGGHRYGASIFEYYLGHHVLADNVIGKIFNRSGLNLAPLSGKPAEAFYNVLKNAGYDMRDVFADFSARVTTWDMDHGDTFLSSEIASFNRMNNNNNNSENPIPEEEVDNKITEYYDVAGTGDQWLTVPDRYKIGAWAYNAYEVDVTQDSDYEVAINPSEDNPEYAEFRAQVVIYNEQNNARRYYKLPVTSAGVITSVQVSASSGDKLYLVVASTPSAKFTDFEAFSYDYKIAAQ